MLTVPHTVEDCRRMCGRLKLGDFNEVLEWVAGAGFELSGIPWTTFEANIAS